MKNKPLLLSALSALAVFACSGRAIDVGPGSGGAGGEAGSGVSGTCATGSAKVVKHVPDCPTEEPTASTPCDIVENGICVYQRDPSSSSSPGYRSFGCFTPLSAGATQWLEADNSAYGSFGVNNQQCPHSAPEEGASCSGHDGQICYYPSDQHGGIALAEGCSCADSSAWSCERSGFGDSAGDIPLPIEVERACTPNDPAEQVKDLTDDEALAWCQWYSGPGPGPLDRVSDKPGFSAEYASSYGALFGVQLCMPALPHDECVQNLRIQPCTATVQQLNDCVGTAGGSFSELWVGDGCGPLLSNPTCTGIIVQQIAENGDKCRAPLD